MSTTPPYYILDPRRLLPASATTDWLGRIVTDYRDPRADFTPSKPQRFTDGLIDSLNVENVVANISRTRESSVTGALTSIVSVSKGHGRSGGVAFETGNMKIVRLNNYRNVFLKMRDDPEVHQHLARVLRPGGPSAYMVVGLLVWSDATLSVAQARSRELGLELQVPALAIAGAAAGVPLPLPVEIGNPAVGREVSDERKVNLSMSVPGSFIFALEYKSVRKKAYAVWKGAKADFDGRGPRGKGDQHFCGDDKQVEVEGEETAEETREEDFDLDMDDEDCVWYDTVAGLEVDEVELENMILAAEKS